MADQGNIFRAQGAPTAMRLDGLTATHVWGSTRVPTQRAYRGSHTDGKAPVSVLATITGATPNAYLTLSRNGTYVINTRANGSGVAFFYDLDDSNDHLYCASEVGSARSWSIAVSGATATVSRISPGTVSAGFAG